MNNQAGIHPYFWTYSKADALSKLGATEGGLSDQEAAKRLGVYGANSINPAKSNSGISLFISQFKSPITIMLIIAALLSAGLGDVPDTVIILIIVLISSLLGFWQERGAANAVRELLKLVQLHCDVLRKGQKKRNYG